ncbi:MULTISPECIES: hypothetical protein [Enterobacteriaceae]|uniref:hypothetical protein n=1 Tax=Enterobacteriaceae TaxID=543 RepID=UPI002E2E390D|nr:hypothetical protein [Klebsiella pneumoniae]MED6004933.1 hypothetical protein [Klebsiella pneumoniae]MED6058253.1 hypothetical protein [Klebsiella pneumoniae]
MNIEEIRRNKPDGATFFAHYALTNTEVVIYYKYVGCNLYRYCAIYDEWNLDKAKKSANFKTRLKPL